jgi:L-aminopeptidase/D-esterase-like protein
LYGARLGLPGEFDGVRPPSERDMAAHAAAPIEMPSLNTVLAIVATDARMEKHECTRMAGAAHDGMARGVSPIHQCHRRAPGP